MRHSEFYFRVADALAGCQLLEQELRLYIVAARAAIRRNLPVHIPYRTSEDDCFKKSLGQLIKKFKELSNDDELIGELNKFNDERNALAHQAIVSCMNPDDELDSPPYNFKVKQLRGMSSDEWLSKIRIDSDMLRKKVFEAGVELEFDHISDAG